jgi:hypothetical protein
MKNEASFARSSPHGAKHSGKEGKHLRARFSMDEFRFASRETYPQNFTLSNFVRDTNFNEAKLEARDADETFTPSAEKSRTFVLNILSEKGAKVFKPVDLMKEKKTRSISAHKCSTLH